MTAPAWLKRHLEAIGMANTDGITIRPRGAYCRSCKAPIIRALDSEVAGLPVVLEPTPITELGETTLLIQGVPTYTIARRGDGLRVTRRDPYRITGRPPTRSGRDYDVIPAHRCHQPVPEALTTLPATTRAQIAPHLIEPPF